MIYNILKSVHIFSVIAWMAGLLYLPRIFMYHADTNINKETSETFKVMERKLFSIIMTPAFIFTWIIGIILVMNIEPALWLNLKIICIVLISAFHMYCAKIRKLFENNNNEKSEVFYRYINEVPTLLFIIVVFLAIFKPGI